MLYVHLILDYGTISQKKMKTFIFKIEDLSFHIIILKIKQTNPLKPLLFKYWETYKHMVSIIPHFFCKSLLRHRLDRLLCNRFYKAGSLLFNGLKAPSSCTPDIQSWQQIVHLHRAAKVINHGWKFKHKKTNESPFKKSTKLNKFGFTARKYWPDVDLCTKIWILRYKNSVKSISFVIDDEMDNPSLRL